VYIHLIVDTRWEDVTAYTEECVNPLEKEFAENLWAPEFAKYSCDTVPLDVEDENENTVWLLETILFFLKKGPNRKAFVDLTSAPREWLFSCFYVRNFFNDVQFYFVKSQRKKSPGDYKLEAKVDPGRIPPQYVLTGELTPPLSWWLTPLGRKRRKPEENIQYKIFKLMYEIAKEKEKKLSRDLSELDIDKKELAMRARARIPHYRDMDVDIILSTISRHLSDIGHFKLFKRVTKKTITLDRSAIVVMLGLFGG